MSAVEDYLDAVDFYRGLESLDDQLGENPFIAAFAPVTLMASGGFFAMTHFQTRKTTEDLDYILPEWAHDEEIKTPIRNAIGEVAEKHKYMADWANDNMALFVTRKAKKLLMENAIKQDIVLWSGENIRILAAPVEWALETKLRRLHAKPRGRKAQSDMSDVLILLKSLGNEKGGKLDMEYYRTLNVNGFDIVPSVETMKRVAAVYKTQYNDDIFA
ncbi:hypothetical protein PHISP_04466 [Aspergillus sp. HF37]|nr:hypothetical protein PHISP_04466 [Aspergillus sp. HF37]